MTTIYTGHTQIIGNSDLDALWASVGGANAAQPGGGRLVNNTTDYLANNAVFNVVDWAIPGTNIRDGVTDATYAINNCFADLVAYGGGLMRFPAGTYRTTTAITFTIPAPASLPLGFTMEGDGESSILLYEAARGYTFNTVNSTDGTTNICSVSAIKIDGANAISGSTAVKIGDNTISGRFRFTGVSIMRAHGTGGVGLHISDVVGFMGINCYVGKCATNVLQEAVDLNLPTLIAWSGSWFREAGDFTSGVSEAGIGYDLRRGYLTTFDSCCLFESNYTEGLRVVPTGNIVQTNVRNAWFENNQRILSASARWQSGHVVANGGAAIKLSSIIALGSMQAARLQGVVNSLIDDVTATRITYLGQSLVATATGYTFAAWSALVTYVVGDLIISGGVAYRCILGHINQVPPNGTYWATGTDFTTIGFAVGQRVHGTEWRLGSVSAANNHFADVTAVSTTAIACAGSVNEAWSAGTTYAIGDVATQGGVAYTCILAHINQVPPNITYWVPGATPRALTVVTVLVDTACHGSLGAWQDASVPIAALENNSVLAFNTFGTYLSGGVLYWDPTTKAVLPGASGQLTLGSNAQRINQLNAVTVDTSSSITSAASVFHGAGGAFQGPSTQDTVVQARTGHLVSLRDDLSAVVATAGELGARFSKGVQEFESAVTYSASMTLDASLANRFVITATNNTNFTVNAPTNPIQGQRIYITVRNASGGALGVVTWDAIFKKSVFTNPANGFSRTLVVQYNNVNWVEMRTDVDVPN